MPYDTPTEHAPGLTPAERVRVMVVDDQALFRAVARELIETMSGVETSRRLIAGEAAIVVVLVTSGATQDFAHSARSCGAVALVPEQRLNPHCCAISGRKPPSLGNDHAIRARCIRARADVMRSCETDRQSRHCTGGA